MKNIYYIFLSLSILFSVNTFGQSNMDCNNTFRFLDPIPPLAQSVDNPPSPCGFFQPNTSIYVNQCSPCGRKISDDDCVNTPTPTLCDLDGFETTTGGYTDDLDFDANGDPFARGFCNGGGTIENNFWVGFTAQTNEVCISVTIGACTENRGIQVAIVETNCVDEFQTVEGNNPCTFQGIPENSSVAFDANNLIPGQPYFIMFDGFAGDVCDIRIDVDCGFAEPEFDVNPVLDATLCPDILNPGSFTAQPGTGAIVDVTIGGNATTDLTFFWLNPGGVLIATTEPTFVAGNVVRGELDGSFFDVIGNYTVQIIDNGSCCPVCTTFPIEIAMPPAATVAIIAGTGSGAELNCNNDLVSLLGNPEDGSVPEVEQWQIVNSSGDRETVVSSFVSSNGRVNELEVTQDILAQSLPGQDFGTATFVYGFLSDIQTLSCFGEASVEVPFDFRIPNIDIATPELLDNQTNPTVELNASLTTTSNLGASFVWTFQDGTTNGIVSGGNTSIATVNQPGVYTLVVINNGSGCSDAQEIEVEITVDVSTPTAIILTPEQLDCRNQDVMLDASNSTSSGNLSYQWFDQSGNMIGNTAIITVSQPGTYTVTTTNANGNDSASVEVFGDFIDPQNVTATGGLITCDNVSGVQLMGNSSTPNVSYLWISDGAVEYPEQNPTVPVAGTYTLIVTNEDNGCSATASAEVSNDINVPSVLFEQISGEVGPINCINTSREFLGFVGGPNPDPNIVLTWFDPNGNPLAGNPIVIDQNSIEGNYNIVGVNPSNNCMNQSQVNVAFDFTLPDFTLEGGTLFCAPNETVTLSAMDTDPMSTSVFEFITPDGTSLGPVSSPTVDIPGVYTLIATNASSGCTAEGAVEVFANNDAPEVSTAGTFTFTCAPGLDTYDLDGSATAANGADELTFEWRLNGALISTNPNPSVSESGTYILTVTNTVSNCMATDSVLIGDVRTDLSLVIEITSSGELLVTTSNGSAPFTYLWNDGTTIDRIENPIIGFAYEVTVTDANGCSEIIAEIFQTNAVQDTELKDITVYPNPSTGFFNISYDETELDIQEVVVYDIRGRKVFTQSYIDQGVFSDLDISHFIQGAYILEVQFEEGVFRDKIMLLK